MYQQSICRYQYLQNVKQLMSMQNLVDVLHNFVLHYYQILKSGGS